MITTQDILNAAMTMPDEERVRLIEAGPRVLANFPESLSEKARAQLQRLGVEVATGTPVADLAMKAASRVALTRWARVVWAWYSEGRTPTSARRWPSK